MSHDDDAYEGKLVGWIDEHGKSHRGPVGMRCVTPVRLIHLNVGGPTHTIEHAGRTWRFEDHPWCGPQIINKDGSVSKRQPGQYSKFWDAYAAWSARESSNGR